MGLTPLAFTGISTFSEDFQTILSRAVSIASIPLQRLQNQDADVLQRKTQLAALSSSVATLASNLSALGSLGTNGALGATSSNTTAVTVVNTGATAAGIYTVNEITSLAKIAAETSLSSYADSQATAVSSTGLLKLWVDGVGFDLDVSADNNLVGLRDAINGLGAGVTASILTLPAGNYLTISATGTGERPIALKDDPTGLNIDLLSDTNHGADAVFKLNGVSITRESNTVNDVVPGLTLTLAGTTASAVTLTLATDRSRISSALETFAAGYNALATAVSAQVGAAAGLLSGDYVVRQVQQNLREIASYSTSSGDIRNLTDLGITFDATGKAVFDSAAFNALSEDDVASVLDFFGSTSTGFGGLSVNLTQLSDPLTGLIKLQQNSYDATDRRLQSEIVTLSDRINDIERSLAAKLQAADALLAKLESQQRMIDSSLRSVELVMFGRNERI